MADGCLVPPKSAFEKLRARLTEYLGFTDGDYRAVVVPLKVSLSAALLTDTAKFQVPGTYKFALHEIRGHLQITDVSAESLAIAGLGNLSYLDRLAAKAANCKLQLVNADRDSLRIFERPNSSDLVVQALREETIKFKEPMMFGNSENIQLTGTLVDTATDIVGGATEYGVLLVGTLIRVRS